LLESAEFSQGSRVFPSLIREIPIRKGGISLIARRLGKAYSKFNETICIDPMESRWAGEN